MGARSFYFLIALCIGWVPAKSQTEHVLEVGVRVQKTVHLYLENGFSVQYTNKNTLAEKWYFGIDYVTSRLGSALGRNALKQGNLLLSSSLMMRPGKQFRPVVRLNTGYFKVNYEEDMFKRLPDSSLLLSTEVGTCLDLDLPLKFTATMGYNLITGNGVKGPGTLFPLFFQTTLAWDVFQKL